MFSLLLPLALAADEDPLADGMQALYDAAFTNPVAYDRLHELCTVYGHRMVGSDRLEAAIDWAAALMREDGLKVTELLMAAYMSAERENTIAFPPPDLETFVPAVARGDWNPGRNSVERRGSVKHDH